MMKTKTRMMRWVGNAASMVKIKYAPSISIGNTGGEEKDNELLDSVNGTDFRYISIRTFGIPQ